MEDKETLQTTDDGEVLASRVEVPGIVTDDQGHSWAIPEIDMSDIGDLYRSPFAIKGDDKFYYQFENRSDVPQMLADHFVTVTRRELGLEQYKDGRANEYGGGVDDVYTVGDMVCLKIPKILAERRKNQERAFSRLAVEATMPKKKGAIDDEPPPSGGTRNEEERAAQDRMRRNVGGQRRVEMSRETILVRPTKPETETVS